MLSANPTPMIEIRIRNLDDAVSSPFTSVAFDENAIEDVVDVLTKYGVHAGDLSPDETAGTLSWQFVYDGKALYVEVIIGDA